MKTFFILTLCTIPALLIVSGAVILVCIVCCAYAIQSHREAKRFANQKQPTCGTQQRANEVLQLIDKSKTYAATCEAEDALKNFINFFYRPNMDEGKVTLLIKRLQKRRRLISKWDKKKMVLVSIEKIIYSEE